jgi:hypothetical protein
MGNVVDLTNATIAEAFVKQSKASSQVRKLKKVVLSPSVRRGSGRFFLLSKLINVEFFASSHLKGFEDIILADRGERVG